MSEVETTESESSTANAVPENPGAVRRGFGTVRARKVFETRQGMARLIAGVEVLLGAIEQVVWDARSLYDDTVTQLREGIGDIREIADSTGSKGADLLAESKRLAKIASTVGRIVFSYRLLSIRGAFMGQTALRKAKERLHRTNAGRFVRLAEDLQGGMVKIGQILSARTDLLPRPFVEGLAQLQDSVEPVPFAEIESALKVVWGGERFAAVAIDPKPIGAASIAQVHIGTLPDGTEVAIKVQRPDIERVLRYDVSSMRRVVDALAAYLPDMDITPLVDEISDQLLAEVDFDRERMALKRAAQALDGFQGARVPRVFDEWSSNTILVTEYCLGDRLNTALAARDQDRRDQILMKFAEVYLRQILIWGFFQPDTHPGNFLVQADDTLVLLDFGCVRELDDDFRTTLAKLMQGFIGGNDPAAAEALADLGFETRSGDLGSLVAAARGTLGGLVAGGSSAWDIEAMIESAETVMLAFDEDPIMVIPKEMVMVGRALSTMGGMFFEHKPDLDPGQLLLPVILEAFAPRAN